MAEQEQERSENATPHKLSEARKKGQVAKSSEVTSALVLVAAAVFIYAHGWNSVVQQFRFDRNLNLLLAQLAGRVDNAPMLLWQLSASSIIGMLITLAPFFVTVMLAAIIANLLQTGPLLSWHPVRPDFNRLNPVHGFKKLLSARMLFELVRSCIKLILLASVAYYALQKMTAQFAHLSGLPAVAYLRLLLDDIGALGIKLALTLAGVALLDFVYTRREFLKKMRMSQREVREEIKQREGHPRIRSRLRALRKEARKKAQQHSQSLRNTKNADVLIANPTHIIVALRYRHGDMPAPQLVAKGVGWAATAMRRIAAVHRIPVVENRTLARRLFTQVDCEQIVPSALYADVARIIVWVFAMRRAQKEMQ